MPGGRPKKHITSADKREAKRKRNHEQYLQRRGRPAEQPEYQHYAPLLPGAPSATLAGLGLRVSADIAVPIDPALLRAEESHSWDIYAQREELHYGLKEEPGDSLQARLHSGPQNSPWGALLPSTPVTPTPAPAAHPAPALAAHPAPAPAAHPAPAPAAHSTPLSAAYSVPAAGLPTSPASTVYLASTPSRQSTLAHSRQSTPSSRNTLLSWLQPIPVQALPTQEASRPATPIQLEHREERFAEGSTAFQLAKQLWAFQGCTAEEHAEFDRIHQERYKQPGVHSACSSLTKVTGLIRGSHNQSTLLPNVLASPQLIGPSALPEGIDLKAAFEGTSSSAYPENASTANKNLPQKLCLQQYYNASQKNCSLKTRFDIDSICCFPSSLGFARNGIH
jgi:hypothetical protein